MNNEELKFAYRVRQVLNQGADELDRKTAARLHEARQQALARQKVAVAGLSLAGFGRFASETLPTYARTLIAASALMAGVVSTYYWNNFEQAAENAETDSALLSDDLPPAAYLDKGFQAWLDRSSQSSQ
ncbi:MAG: hypothetical protein A2040_03940 [Rhodocyclales bacterium GWA2_65_19]|nr:MAG: hypothetical protein A2040_03940 [Rhodocyclales bacterium GWA2_65_19]